MSAAKAMIVCAGGVTISTACLLASVLSLPAASWALIAETSSWCGTGRAAARGVLLLGIPVLVLGAFSGARMCREHTQARIWARSFARLTVVVAATCAAMVFVIFPLIVRGVYFAAGR